ncbi:DUF29 domain-containing protein [Endozoicomonas sp. ONNA1]|uniref:DUF29 domain-containing protein n=1 Tax=Endozoicomonas sp. ONNA1 TaxID=2828740 RepID=UPI00214800B0|nr:DUF29 domain-containing protein [Endozoicomonas sp. ONNA1]
MTSLYHSDHHKWLSEQVSLLDNEEFDKLDIKNLVEELELNLMSDLRELGRRLKTLISHLLKMNYQTTVLKDACNNHFIKKWIGTIRRTREDIIDLIEKNPSLKNCIGEVMAEAYPKAKNQAIDEMNDYAHNAYDRLNKDSFPTQCPWNFEQIMETEWYPLNGVEIQ